MSSPKHGDCAQRRAGWFCKAFDCCNRLSEDYVPSYALHTRAMAPLGHPWVTRPVAEPGPGPAWGHPCCPTFTPCGIAISSSTFKGKGLGICTKSCRGRLVPYGWQLLISPGSENFRDSFCVTRQACDGSNAASSASEEVAHSQSRVGSSGCPEQSMSLVLEHDRWRPCSFRQSGRLILAASSLSFNTHNQSRACSSTAMPHTCTGPSTSIHEIYSTWTCVSVPNEL